MYSFTIKKRKKNNWYKLPKMAGHVWARSMLLDIEYVINKYSKTMFHRFIVSNVFDTKNETWQFFSFFTKKELNQVRYILKNSPKLTPMQLHRWLENQPGMLKTKLHWCLEYAAYKYDRKAYVQNYYEGLRWLGLNLKQAKKRVRIMMQHHEKILIEKEFAGGK
jgi:hypothetical protein